MRIKVIASVWPAAPGPHSRLARRWHLCNGAGFPGSACCFSLSLSSALSDSPQKTLKTAIAQKRDPSSTLAMQDSIPTKKTCSQAGSAFAALAGAGTSRSSRTPCRPRLNATMLALLLLLFFIGAVAAQAEDKISPLWKAKEDASLADELAPTRKGWEKVCGLGWCRSVPIDPPVPPPS